ncbi:MAG TPA: hypothetical protein GXZ30_02165 [Propionibacterium sp.]|jgi:hypothetical protein|nr:hypothetical protein [Propionibacterium sp.]
MNQEQTERRRPKPDLFSLFVGLLFTTFAGGALYAAIGGNPNPRVWNVALPVFLIALGVLGLLLARRS